MIPHGATVALFDFPNYSNVGDTLIWLGQIRFLSEINKSSIVFVGARPAMDSLPDFSDDVIVCITGGGNFGDLWADHQALRLALLKRFPSNRVVQLPQSIHFENEWNMDETRSVLRSHPDFHLLLRDRKSLEIAQGLHSGNSVLCPDMAFFLEGLRPVGDPQHPILALLRTDHEKAYATAGNFSDVHVTDWVDNERIMLKKLTRKVNRLYDSSPLSRGLLDGVKLPLYNRLAARRLQRGIGILSSGRVVITDRLHAHILCTLMGVKHVVLDNSYNKIANYRSTWDSGKSLSVSAGSFEEAVEQARAMLQ